ncbi:MAG: FUSC family protein [Flavobacteriales bacterium]|nr:FUSC family protein [Flavobacteriales bacterium]
MGRGLRIPRTRRTVHHAARLQPGEWRWAAGLRAALAIGLPLLAFTLAGRPDHGLVAALGGFTALYGTDRPLRQQLRLLPGVAAGLVASAALGAFAAWSPWATTLALVAVTAAAAYLCWGVRTGPPGAMLFVLVAAIAAHVGQRMPAATVPALVACGAALALVPILVSARLPGRWRVAADDLPVRPLAFRLDRSVKRNVGRVTAGVALACLASLWLEAFRLHWVVITAIAILQGAHDRSFTLVRVVQRLAGTLLGLLVFLGIAHLHPQGLPLVAMVMALQFGIEVVIFRNYVLGLGFITPLALTLASFGQGLDPSLAVEGRWNDTLLGAAVAVAVLSGLEVKRRFERDPAPVA